jgi:hypothetical protein
MTTSLKGLISRSASITLLKSCCVPAQERSPVRIHAVPVQKSRPTLKIRY